MWNDPSGAEPDKPPIEEVSKKLIGNPKPVDENVLESINHDGSFTGEQANIPLMELPLQETTLDGINLKLAFEVLRKEL